MAKLDRFFFKRQHKIKTKTTKKPFQVGQHHSDTLEQIYPGGQAANSENNRPGKANVAFRVPEYSYKFIFNKPPQLK